MNDLFRVAELVRGLAPSCGAVRLVGVDGHAGSGKSTFAAALAGALGGAPVVHLDDLRSHDALFAWTERLEQQVLAPLAHGRAAQFPAYDWDLRQFREPRRIPPAPVVLIEGVGAGRRELRPRLARLYWMDLPPRDSWARGRHRDGPAQRDFWDGWEEAERRHFAEDPTRPAADALVRECLEGYEVLPKPSEAAAARQTVTDREGPAAKR